MRISSAGNVGIGTSSPLFPLHVAGKIKANERVITPIIASPDDTAVIHITNSANVGIGTSSPESLLELQPSAVVTNLNSVILQIGGDVADNAINAKSTIGFGYSSSGREISPAMIGYETTSTLGGTEGDLFFATRSGTTNVAPTEAMRIDSNGRVGIGTSNPSNTLHVDSGTADTVALFKSSGDAKAYIVVKDSGSSGGAFFGADGTHTIIGTGGSTERMRIDSAGNVGIGASSPSQMLEVHSTTNNLDTGPVIRVSGASDYSEWATKDTITRLQHVENSADATNGYGKIEFKTNCASSSTSPTRGGFLWTTGVGSVMAITNTGNVGIGATSPSEKLYVTGNIYATGNITAYSDERIKENINVVPNALDAVDAIRGVTYTRTDTKEDSVGVIAQEVEALFPELITENNEGMKSVNYNGLIGVLFAAVKELSAEVKLLKENK
jgi:hypothetical protein